MAPYLLYETSAFRSKCAEPSANNIVISFRIENVGVVPAVRQRIDFGTRVASVHFLSHCRQNDGSSEQSITTIRSFGNNSDGQGFASTTPRSRAFRLSGLWRPESMSI